MYVALQKNWFQIKLPNLNQAIPSFVFRIFFQFQHLIKFNQNCKGRYLFSYLEQILGRAQKQNWHLFMEFQSTSKLFQANPFVLSFKLGFSKHKVLNQRTPKKIINSCTPTFECNQVVALKKIGMTKVNLKIIYLTSAIIFFYYKNFLGKNEND